jgi:hypothetical protein
MNVQAPLVPDPALRRRYKTGQPFRRETSTRPGRAGPRLQEPQPGGTRSWRGCSRRDCGHDNDGVPSRLVVGKAMSILKSTAFGRKPQLRFADSNRLTDEPNFVGPRCALWTDQPRVRNVSGTKSPRFPQFAGEFAICSGPDPGGNGSAFVRSHWCCRSGLN